MLTNTPFWNFCWCHANNICLVISGIPLTVITLVLYFLFSWLKFMMQKQNCRPQIFRESVNVLSMLCLAKTFYITGNIVVLDSSFCVLQGLVDMNKLGVYGASLIKRSHYWS